MVIKESMEYKLEVALVFTIEEIKKKIYGFIGILALVGVGIYVKNYFVIDECLDSGGRWNHIVRACEDWPNKKSEMKIEL